MSEWISVKDRLPISGEYIVAIDGFVFAAEFVRTSDTGGIWRIKFSNNIVNVTHWMPYPDPSMYQVLQQIEKQAVSKEKE